MSRKILLWAFLSGLLGGIVLLVVCGKSDWLSSWSIGTVFGIYPFAFWLVARPVMEKLAGASKTDSNIKSKSFYILIGILGAAKFIIIGALALKMGSLGFVHLIPFLAGFLVMAPIVLTITLLDYFFIRAKQETLGR